MTKAENNRENVNSVEENRRDRDISYEIVENIGVLAEYETGWCKELNRVSWNGSKPKYDIRDWAPGHNRMSRGVTLHDDEMEQLVSLYEIRRDEGENTAQI